MKPTSKKNEAQRLFEAKFKRRQELARLPFDKKILILIQLQKIAKALPSNPKRVKTKVWNFPLR